MSTIAPSAAPASAFDPHACFTGRIRRVWTSPLYLGGLMVVAGAMVLLPIVYVGMVAATAYGVYYHATHSGALLLSGSGGGMRARLFVYLAPLVIGAILVVFMIKPLFAREPKRRKRVSLVRANDPRLFEFVDRICEMVGSPKPRRIDVDCQVNASASFRHGIWSLFWPGDLVLTIGVPLAAGMTLRDFAGVLAHEFGHFAQGLGMRFSYLISSVNGWFCRVVYQRDSWDEWLAEQSESDSGWLNVVMYLARFFVFLTRLILRLLMLLGHMISCGMSRQMEFNADLHAIRATGSLSLIETEYELALLNTARSAIYNELRASWRERKLADDLPGLISLKRDELPAEVRAAVIKACEGGKTGWFDTHPCSAARIRQAHKHDDPGVFCGDGPASQLFSNFSGLCKSITLSHYQDIIGPEVSAGNLVSTADVTRRREQARRSREAAQRYYFGCVSFARPIVCDGHSAIFKLDEAAAREKLATARKSLEANAAAIQACNARFTKADKRLHDLVIIGVLIEAEHELDAERCGLPACTTAAVAEARAAAASERRSAAESLGKITAVMRTRTEAALRMLSAEAVAGRVRGIDRLQRRVQELLASLNAVAGVSGAVGEIRKAVPGMLAHGQLLNKGGEDEECVRQTLRLIEQQRTQLAGLRSSLAPFSYPFEHAAGQITLARYAVGELPEKNNLGGMISAAQEAVESIEQLYARLLGEVAQICEAVEAALGLPPPKAATPAPAPTDTEDPLAA